MCDIEPLDDMASGDTGLGAVRNPTREQCLAAVIRNGADLEHVPVQDEELCIAAVSHHSTLSLPYVRRQTPNICMAAVVADGLALCYVHKQTPEICMAAVMQNASAIRHVRAQTEELCLLAVTENANNLPLVRHQTPKICMAAVMEVPISFKYVQTQTEEICIAAIIRYPPALIYVKCQTPKICMAAVTRDGFMICHVREQTPEICLAAVKQTPKATRCIHSWSDELRQEIEKVCDEQISLNPRMIEHVYNPTFNQCLISTNSAINMLENLGKIPTYDHKLRTVLTHLASKLCGLLALELSRSLLIGIAMNWIKMCVHADLRKVMHPDLNRYAIDRLLTRIADVAK